MSEPSSAAAERCEHCSSELANVEESPPDAPHMGRSCRWKCGSWTQVWPQSTTKLKHHQSQPCRIRELEQQLAAVTARAEKAERAIDWSHKMFRALKVIDQESFAADCRREPGPCWCGCHVTEIDERR